MARDSSEKAPLRFRTVVPEEKGATMVPVQKDMFDPDPVIDAALRRGPMGGPYQLPPVTEPIPYKYQEDMILKEIAAYIDTTYKGHYVGEDNVQSLDLILATGHATGFNVGNMLKYGSRYGKKRGYNRDDLLKVVHYAIFELYNHSKNHMGEED